MTSGAYIEVEINGLSSRSNAKLNWSISYAEKNVIYNICATDCGEKFW